MTPLVVRGLEGFPEIEAGTDLAELISAHPDGPAADGEIVVVTSKVVSKALGLATPGDRDDSLALHTDRVVARRGRTTIVRTPHGLTLAMAGIDESNVAVGRHLPLPPDPDHEARTLRGRLQTITGHRLGVVLTDTAGRAWRTGQTDLAIGVAGLPALVDLSGESDPYGNQLQVTAPAVADEIAAAADLVQGKLSRCPVAIVSGLSELVRTDDGPGAAELIRPEQEDLFGYGAAAAVAAAGRRRPADVRGFAVLYSERAEVVAAIAGEVAATTAGLVELRVESDFSLSVRLPDQVDQIAGMLAAGALIERVQSMAFASRWTARVYPMSIVSASTRIVARIGLTPIEAT